jgi:NAD(P)-dependent dehydrogenase (short-subunit alcohol dehydrogenase family)
MKGLDGKVALVTGGGKGIGRAVALALSARGVRVIVTGREEKALAETVGEIAFGGGKARHVAGDVRGPQHAERSVARAIETFGGLDFVIANAGQSGRVDLGQELERAEAILQTNLMGAYYTFHAAAPKMAGPGRLIAMSSVLGKFGVPGYAAYCASKAGLLGLVRACAHELGPRRITANAIVPGWVSTAMSDAGIDEIALSQGKTRDEALKEALSAFPLGRFLEPEEIAELVCFLCSTAGDGITGQALSICGGSTAFGA